MKSVGTDKVFHKKAVGRWLSLLAVLLIVATPFVACQMNPSIPDANNEAAVSFMHEGKLIVILEGEGNSTTAVSTREYLYLYNENRPLEAGIRYNFSEEFSLIPEELEVVSPSGAAIMKVEGCDGISFTLTDDRGATHVVSLIDNLPQINDHLSYEEILSLRIVVGSIFNASITRYFDSDARIINFFYGLQGIWDGANRIIGGLANIWTGFQGNFPLIGVGLTELFSGWQQIEVSLKNFEAGLAELRELFK